MRVDDIPLLVEYLIDRYATRLGKKITNIDKNTLGLFRSYKWPGNIRTFGVPGGDRRLDRILELIQSCRYSIHDLSRVEVSRRSPRIPRFNMPFELGLSVPWAKMYPDRHTWFVCETERYRVDRSLSDLGGTDPNIHDGTVAGVMRELCNAFVRHGGPRPTVPDMLLAHNTLAHQRKAV